MADLMIADTPMAEVSRKTVTVRIEAELARRCGLAAAFQNLSVPEFLKRALEPIVESAIAEGIAAEAKRNRRSG